MKRTYTKPELTTHGNVEKITLNAGAQNRDFPSGPNNTAFPNA